MNPCCCGCSLKTGCLIIGILEMVLSALVALAVIIVGGVAIGGVLGATNDKQHDSTALGASLGLVIALVVVLLAVMIAKFCLGLLLKRGADQEDLRKCRIWFIVNAVLLGLAILSIIFNIAIVGVIWTSQLSNVLGIAYQVYCMWVVHEFMNELRAGTTFNAAPASGKVYSNA